MSNFSHIPWYMIDYDAGVELSWAMWKDLYLLAIDQTVPKLKWNHHKFKHWISHDTISLMHKKRKLHKHMKLNASANATVKYHYISNLV